MTKRMRDFILDDERYSVMVIRGHDGRQLPITVNNWREIKDAIELSVYESELREIGLRPDAESEANTLNKVWLP